MHKKSFDTCDGVDEDIDERSQVTYTHRLAPHHPASITGKSY
jgi:hypothetical protein